MDETISMWIIEFLLRQDNSALVLDDIPSVVPSLNSDYRLKMALLLRIIAATVSNGSVDENVLRNLERVEELNHGEGKTASIALKAAYSAVAVDCTVRFLEEKDENIGKYLAKAKSIWRERINKMEKADGKVGLLSDELFRKREEIEGAIWDNDGRVRLLSRDSRNEAVQAVKNYLAEAWMDLGPSYLERLAENLLGKWEKISKEMADIQRSSQNFNFDDTATASERSVDDGQNLEVEKTDLGDEESQRMIPTSGNKHAARRFWSMPRRAPPRIRGAKIVDVEELDGEVSPIKNNDADEVPRRMQESGSCVQEKEFPNTINEDAEDINGQKKEKQSGTVCDSNADGANKRDKGHSEIHGLDDQKNQPTEGEHGGEDVWSDEDLGSSPDKFKAASPKKRKRRKLWSGVEEETLRDGVRKFGRGNWKVILQAYGSILVGRSEVDIKDKWRNLTK